MIEKELLINIVEYFKINIFQNHINASLKVHSKLKSYKINPIVANIYLKSLKVIIAPKVLQKHFIIQES